MNVSKSSRAYSIPRGIHHALHGPAGCIHHASHCSRRATRCAFDPVTDLWGHVLRRSCFQCATVRVWSAVYLAVWYSLREASAGEGGKGGRRRIHRRAHVHVFLIVFLVPWEEIEVDHAVFQDLHCGIDRSSLVCECFHCVVSCCEGECKI